FLLDLPSRSMWDNGAYKEAFKLELSRMYGSELKGFEIIEASQDPSPSAHKGGIKISVCYRVSLGD
ncbi:MAG: hypothetical protein AABW87_00620, partial [Nanoarchaeota archaeon]